MNKIKIILALLTLSISTSVLANEVKCKTFDIGCKTKKFINETKDFQKKGLEDGKDQIKRIPDNLRKK
ncbi:MAG: hypothetical protein CMI78_01595 [Candidatus Pelagibacter sp.]|nr:hypothetical protein [Candidatus Pelagibacter sp.]OUW68026.1 MAG: hypothetical protein CBD62_02600 [Candidatus Pelagibacter sp. TMED202]|tara:strand:+ start:36 stop:239 length:204 start_codon:yes stop_codon:yes gene_type:complete